MKKQNVEKYQLLLRLMQAPDGGEAAGVLGGVRVPKHHLLVRLPAHVGHLCVCVFVCARAFACGEGEGEDEGEGGGEG